MAKRKDGIETRERILRVACRVFADKGYHDATVEEICSQAGTNIAAINYHFGSKDQLYAQVWRCAFDEANKAYPPEGGLGSDAPAEDRLRGTIHSLVGRAVNPSRIGHAGKLLLRELVYPTDVIEDVKHKAMGRLQRRMDALMRDLLGPEASEEQRLLCAMSIAHQCITIGVQLFTGRMPPHVRIDKPSEELVETLTDHINRFSLAGLNAIRNSIKTGPKQHLSATATEMGE
ncbi:MAG: CerR family C-terminal domain-containing protein [Sedimentisphaerales bacterium]|nr:CerR family C-terminal domain-containing protein [Sedimentisphaerales bacterium]